MRIRTTLLTAAFFGAFAVSLTTSELTYGADPTHVVVCSDGGAGGYEAFPDVCRLQDGRLMVVCYAGYGHVALPNATLPRGGRIVATYSSDEGKTWSPAQTIVDTPIDDRDPSVTQLADGRLFLTFFTYRPQEGGDSVCVSCLSESSDGGKTWSEPREIYENYPCSSPIRVLSNGTLIWGLYREYENDHFGAVGLSEDGGKTWSEPIAIPHGEFRLDAETDVIELKDGSIYAIQREQMAWSCSTDGGKTWSVSQDVGFKGHCPYFLRTKDDAILLALRLPNTCLRVSRDECKTWSEPIPVDSCIGAYPSMVELKDGTVLVVYYVEGEGSDIRAKRFQVGDGYDVREIGF